MPSFPATLLLAVSETVDSKPGEVPLPAVEGLFDGLFDAGHIVFNTKDGAEVPPKLELQYIAVTGGARFVLEVSVSYARTIVAENTAAVDASARYTLFKAQSGIVVSSGELTDTNRGSEKDVDLFALGFRLGRKIAAAASDEIGRNSD